MKQKNLKIILLHGNGGSTVEDNWFPYAKTEFEKLGLEVISKTFPDNKLARSEYWLPFLRDELKADEKTILVGSSTGAVAAMRFAEANKIYGSVINGLFNLPQLMIHTFQLQNQDTFTIN